MKCVPAHADLAAMVPEPGATTDWVRWREAIPALAALDDTPQDPFYHAEGDVGTHTRMVVASMTASEDYAAADGGGRFRLFMAALLHDIAKPSCTKTGPDGRITSKGHSARGAIDTRILLWRAGTPFAEREAVCRMIARHQRPFFVMRQDRPEFAVRKLSCELVVSELCALAEADIRGRRCEDARSVLDDIELMRELAREEGCYRSPRSFPDAHSRLTYFRSEGARGADYPVYRESGSRVVLMSGLPASGKDTHVAKRYPNLPVVSFDDARRELGLRHGPKSGAAVQLVKERAKALLREGRPFVWNATHLSRQMRAKSLDLLYAYGAEVEIVYLEADATTLFARNRARGGAVPDRAIERLLLRWEPPLPTEAHAVRYPSAQTGLADAPARGHAGRSPASEGP